MPGLHKLLLLSALLLAAPAVHADPPPVEAVLLVNGDALAGKVISFDDAKLVIDVQRGGKTERVEVAIDQVQPGSVYALKAARVPDGDGNAHLALARWCMRENLPTFADAQFSKAASADPNLSDQAAEGRAQAKALRARMLYQRAVAAMAKGDDVEASRLFGVIVKRYPKPFGPAAQKALAFLLKRQQQGGAQQGGAGQGAGADPGPGPGPGAKPAPPAKPDLDPRSQARLSALARHLRALTEAGYYSRTDSKARRAFEDASSVADQGLAEVDRMRQRRLIDDERYAALRKPFIDAAVDLSLQLAVIYLRRDNEYGANRWLTRALTYDPDNKRARELRLFIVTDFRDRRRR